MKLEQVLCMLGGTGDHSYATVFNLEDKTVPDAIFIMKQSVEELYHDLLPENYVVVADLGCSSGPNAFMYFAAIMDAIGESCDRLSRRAPEIQLLLNDLPGNDFNTLFGLFASSKEKMKEEKGEKFLPFYPAGVPGSFYGRLFPARSVHFIYSSLCLHWLSQVPQGLETNGNTAVNKGNIYISKTSPPLVSKLYTEQFQRDFYSFLKLRSEEICTGGRMVLMFFGRRTWDPAEEENNYISTLLSKALNEMVLEGILKASEVDSFNLPYYQPCMEEVKMVTRDEGSFDVAHESVFDLNWEVLGNLDDKSLTDNNASGEYIAKIMRSVLEPLFASHFGEAIIDELFSRLTAKLTKHIETEKGKYVIFVVSLRRIYRVNS
ncbi:anthranilate O-methyltransferase 3-like [Ananas comosus]|uniref:Anthranilate O-methyltransferase 3-like n=1 Tax=Ananas comosus TaxID=4615 RepID=A0A6P5EIC4_ANACO|nr:anthranilate O-methyltransferase 3-like [Ananas comosus]